MKALFMLLMAAAMHAAVNPNRVLILVNDAMPAETGTGGIGASVYVGTHYAAARGIPVGNILHLTTDTTQLTTIGHYQTQIETPLLAALNANSGLLKHQILYIVPTYGIPYNVSSNGGGGRIAADSIMAAMYDPTTFVYNTPSISASAVPYNVAIPVNSGLPYTTLWTPPAVPPQKFEPFSDQREAAGDWKMFVVSRLDGLSAVIAAALVDKAISAETNLKPNTGTAYWDWIGTKNSTEFQLYIDTRVRDGAVQTYNRGYTTYLHRQTTSDAFVDDPKPTAPPVTNSSAGPIPSAPNATFAFAWIYFVVQGQYTWGTGAIGTGFISCSGDNLRNPNAENPGTADRWGCSWAGRLIEDGVTGTWGTVDEPARGTVNYYPSGIDVAHYFYGGYNFGDSFYLSSPSLRWTVFVVGDPLYELQTPMTAVIGKSAIQGKAVIK